MDKYLLISISYRYFSVVLPHLQKTNPSTNRVRLLDGFSIFCELLDAYVSFGVPEHSVRSLLFRESCQIPLLFRLKNSPNSYPILQTSSGFLHFLLQPLIGDLMNREVRMSRSTGRARAVFGKRVDPLHDSVKKVVGVHGRSLLVMD